MTISRFISIICFLPLAGLAQQQATDSIKQYPYRASNTRHTDIIHTSLDVKFDWNKSELVGTASITAKPYFKPTSSVTLDARGMAIGNIEVYDISKTKGQAVSMIPSNTEMIGVKKTPSSFKYENDSIKINLGKEFKSNEKYLIRINYTAKPNELKKGGSNAITDDKGLYFINPKGEDKNKMPQIWTQGETQSSSAWFPTIDSPNEKMTNDISMTVDNKYTTLSNGVLTTSKKNADGTRTDLWKMTSPHSPYLVMMAVGEFKKVTDAPWNGKEISYYVEKEYEAHAKAIFGNTKEMIEFYSKVLGTPYPWAKYAQVVVRDYVSGAMENTSATLHGDFMVYQTQREILDGKKGEAVIAHELFHQWFGDYVTAESWSNLPLNESFATYGEYLWFEYKNGRDAADAHGYQSRQGYFGASDEKQVEVIRYHYDSREDMFDAFSYNKGGQILHMLRKYVGDDVFFAALKLYLERNKFKSAEIHDLRLAFEEVSGEDLNWFFNQWFLAKGHPELEITSTYDAAKKMVKLNVIQKQNLKECPLYKLPVDVDVYYAGKKERHRIFIDKQNQDFFLPASVNPNLVNFDAERQLLAPRNYTKTNEQLIFMYQNAPLFNDRLEAINGLKKQLDDPTIFNLLMGAAQNDNHSQIRMIALNNLSTKANTKETELKPLLLKIIASDKHNPLRARAVEILGENYKGAELESLFNKLLNEQSYAVLSAALKAYSNLNFDACSAFIKPLESEKNESVFSAIASIYAKYGNDENLSYFSKSKTNFSNFEFFNYARLYLQFLPRCNNAVSFETAASDLIEIIKNGNSYVKDYCKKLYSNDLIQLIKTKQESFKSTNNASKQKEFENLDGKLESLLKSM